MNRIILSASIICGAAGVACGAAPSASTSTSDEAASSVASEYTCTGSSSATFQRFTLSFNASSSTHTAKLTNFVTDGIAYSGGTGTLDPSYTPRSATYAGTKRYAGFPVYQDNSNSVDLLAQQKLVDGEASGTAFLRFSASDGGNTERYACKKGSSSGGGGRADCTGANIFHGACVDPDDNPLPESCCPSAAKGGQSCHSYKDCPDNQSSSGELIAECADDVRDDACPMVCKSRKCAPNPNL
jgi:hypothetical protein